MARLNDPPAPAPESLDALKRRFIRQNREIARVNSTQSQRIRNLETEISRLLAENIALREQAIASAAEAERCRATGFGRNVIELKLKLESKLSEVNCLVEELGDLPGETARRSSLRRRKSGIMHNNAHNLEERDYRNRQAAGSETACQEEGHDGRLPAILEDKYYPRRTFETEELRILTAAANIEQEDTESPDLGPPPVAHFEVADPIAFDSAKSPKRVSGGIFNNDEEVVALPKNLETRRKRRTSSLLHDMSSLHVQSQELGQDDDRRPAPLLKSSAKRKFEASEMEIEATQIPHDDDFEFSRKESTTMNRSRPSRFTGRPAKGVQEHHLENQPFSPQKVLEQRAALAPKSTNSPAKRTTTALCEKGSEKHVEIRLAKLTNHRTALPNVARITRIDSLPFDEQNRDSAFAPATPAPPLEDIISPPSSAVDTILKHKPMEAAITNSVEDVLNGSIGRGSRRAKAAVSYAEPNLRDKMRRPDKKLVGAVEGISKPGNTSDREFGREPTRDQSSEPGQSANALRVVKIKTEKESADEDEQWKDLIEAEAKQEAVSPLHDKEKLIHKSIDVRKKRTYSESEGTKYKQTTTVATMDGNLDKAVARLSIYDPPNSSPISTFTEDRRAATSSSHQQAKQNPPTTHTRSSKSSDRPSTTTATAVATSKSRRHSVHPFSDTTVAAATTQAPARPSSAMSARDTTTGKENVHPVSSKLKRASSVQAMSHSGTVQNRGHGLTTTAIGERTLGARRRSMMV